jgi:hypothetical protein
MSCSDVSMCHTETPAMIGVLGNSRTHLGNAGEV